jgi:hypothetical protein
MYVYVFAYACVRMYAGVRVTRAFMYVYTYMYQNICVYVRSVCSWMFVYVCVLKF